MIAASDDRAFDPGTVSVRGLLRWQFRLAHECLDAAIDRIRGEAFHTCPLGMRCSPGVSYAQTVFCEDLSVNGVLGAGTPLALSTWAGRTGLSELPPRARATNWRAWAHRVRLDEARLRRYATAVYASTDAYIAALPDRVLDSPRGEKPACLLTALLLSVSMRRGEIITVALSRGKSSQPNGAARHKRGRRLRCDRCRPRSHAN
jgi:hypothetical protein